jgi:hypothetical protein
MTKIQVVRDSKNKNPYLMIKLSFNELSQLGQDIEAIKILMKENES